ncbi:hypothetical protein LINPERPRIM_LOCUS113 [Linum perenne]
MDPAVDLISEDPLPLVTDCRGEATPSYAPTGKENLTPHSFGPGSSLPSLKFPLPKVLGLVADSFPAQPKLGMPSDSSQPNVIQLIGNGVAQLSDSTLPPPSAETVKAGSNHAQAANKSSIPPKNSKISKRKIKDSSGFVGLKLKDSTLRFGAKSSSSAMEEL